MRHGCSRRRAAHGRVRQQGNPQSEISGASGSLLIQLPGVATTVVYGFVVSFAILKIIDPSIGLRVTEEQEREGLDISLHGESIG